MENRAYLKEKLKEVSMELTEVQLNQFITYYEMLVEKNKVMNLTGITEENDVYEKHFYDSLIFSFDLDLNNKKIVDIGTGAGFPGLVLAICYPNSQITLVEPLTKRCNFLSNVVNELNLKNVTIINKRSEELTNYKEYFDIATARAVARLNILLELIMPLVKINGLFVALKGRQGEEEINEAKNALFQLNSKIIKVQKLNLFTDNDTRINIFISPEKKISNKYPRNYSQIKKKPL